MRSSEVNRSHHAKKRAPRLAALAWTVPPIAQGACVMEVPDANYPSRETLIMNTFSFRQFEEALGGLLPLRKREVRGQLRAFGGTQGVGLDLLLASFNADYVHSAALQLAFVDGSDAFDQFSLTCLRCFLTAVLGSTSAAEAWSTATFQHLQADGVTSCTTAHDGFSLSLLQQKPYQMFLITATDSENPDGSEGTRERR